MGTLWRQSCPCQSGNCNLPAQTDIIKKSSGKVLTMLGKSV